MFCKSTVLKTAFLGGAVALLASGAGTAATPVIATESVVVAVSDIEQLNELTDATVVDQDAKAQITAVGATDNLNSETKSGVDIASGLDTDALQGKQDAVEAIQELSESSANNGPGG